MSAVDVAVVTVSDGVAAGTREDRSGDVIAQMIAEAGGSTYSRQVVPDEHDEIAALLTRLADEERVPLVLTTGGTGFGQRDVTPEATSAVVEREARGIPEAMRTAAVQQGIPMAMVSRARAGIRGRTIIINLPGSPKAVRENLAVVLPVLGHVAELVAGDSEDHAPLSLDEVGGDADGEV